MGGFTNWWLDTLDGLWGNGFDNGVTSPLQDMFMAGGTIATNGDGSSPVLTP